MAVEYRIGTIKIMDLQIESPDQTPVLKLCWLVEQHRQLQMEYARIKWRVSYYQKALREADDNESLPGERQEIIRQLEVLRLLKLKKQKNLIDKNRKFLEASDSLRKQLRAQVISENQVMTEIRCYKNVLVSGITTNYVLFNSEQIAEKADQYEAEMALNRVLTK